MLAGESVVGDHAYHVALMRASRRTGHIVLTSTEPTIDDVATLPIALAYHTGTTDALLHSQRAPWQQQLPHDLDVHVGTWAIDNVRDFYIPVATITEIGGVTVSTFLGTSITPYES